jgi:Isochorismatase family
VHGSDTKVDRLASVFVTFPPLGVQMKVSMGRQITIEAKPQPITIDTSQTAVIVVDMQNDFGSKGGMFDRAGLDISIVQRAIPPTAKVLAAARSVGIKIVYLKMGFRPDLSDVGAPGSPNRAHLHHIGVGTPMRAPSGAESPSWCVTRGTPRLSTSFGQRPLT